MKERGAAAYVTSTVANLAVATCNLQGVKEVSARDFDAVAALNHWERANDLLSRRTAQIILALAAEGKIPSWVLRELDFEMVRMAAG